MTIYRFAGTDTGVVLSPTLVPSSYVFPATGPELTPVPLNAKMAATGHSIVDAVIKWPWSGVITSAGQTPDIVSGTGPYAGAQIRWEDDPAAPNAVRAALNAAGPTEFDLFLGIEGHGPSHSVTGRDSVETYATQYDPPAPSGADEYAKRWHNLAASKGARTFYANFWQDDKARLFGSSWRAALDYEAPLWDGIIDYVNANRNPGTPAMRLVPWIQVFMGIYDAIESGDITGVAMVDFFSDNVHPSAYGQWAQMATMMLVMYHRDPDELSHSIPLEFGGTFSIPSGLASKLRPVVRSVCFALPRTGLA